MRKLFTFLIPVLCMIYVPAFGQTLTLSMANATLTGVAPNQVLEFDIMMTCNQAGTYLSSGQVYVDYNTAAFGSSAVAGSNLVIDRGALLSEQNITMTGFKYFLGNPQDNTASKATSNFFTFSFSPPNALDYTEVPTTAAASWHFEFDVMNVGQLAGLTFDQGLSSGQFFYVGASGLPAPYTVVFGADYSTLDLANIPQLPLEGLELSATPRNRSIDLTWTINKEINNKGFFIQRATDGENYDQLGWIDGAGDAENTRYDFTDETAAVNQTYYYRLQQVDLDGDVHFSPVILTRIEASSYLEIQLTPNPVEGNEAVFKLTSPEEGEIRYSISDNAGKVVMRGVWAKVPKGTSGRIISIPGFAAGVYNVAVTDGFRQAHSAMIVK